jgi:cell division GTPase FtsZ
LLVSITAGLDSGIETFAAILDELTENLHEEMVLVAGVSYEPSVQPSQVNITAFFTCYPEGYRQVNFPSHTHEINEADIPLFLRRSNIM